MHLSPPLKTLTVDSSFPYIQPDLSLLNIVPKENLLDELNEVMWSVSVKQTFEPRLNGTPIENLITAARELHRRESADSVVEPSDFLVMHVPPEQLAQYEHFTVFRGQIRMLEKILHEP